VFDLRQRSRFRRVSFFLITTIWLIDKYDSVNLVNGFLSTRMLFARPALASARAGR